MDDIKNLLSRKMFEVLRNQNPGDIAELRRLAKMASDRGYLGLATTAEETADLFEAEDLDVKEK